MLNRTRNELTRAGEEPVRLTPLETSLMATFMLHPGRVLSSEALINAVWGIGGDRTMLKQLVYRLRSRSSLTSHSRATSRQCPA